MNIAITEAVRSVSRRLAGRYVAGSRPEDALRCCVEYRETGLQATIGYWNRADESPTEVAAICRQMIAAISDVSPGAYLSIKATALDFREDLILGIASLGRERGVGLHFDSMQPETAERTLTLIGKAARVADQIGCTLPARWRRSADDARRAVDLGLRVRVVRGQWADPSSPRGDSRRDFEELIDRLAGRARHVAVATHDHELAGASLASLQAQATPCEVELLYGLPRRRVIELARSAGVATRLYIPCGEAWLPYALSQLLGQPGRIAWLLSEWRSG